STSRASSCTLSIWSVTRPRATIPFFFQAEDGIRDSSVTGVQTCALPISARAVRPDVRNPGRMADRDQPAVVFHGDLEAPAGAGDREYDHCRTVRDPQPVHGRPVAAPGEAARLHGGRVAHVFRLLPRSRAAAAYPALAFADPP